MTRTLRHALTLAVLAVLPSVLTAGPIRDRIREVRANVRLALIGQGQPAPARVCATTPAARPAPVAVARPLPAPTVQPQPADTFALPLDCPNGKCPLRK